MDPAFPGAAIISAPASFRCRSYAGIFSFSESIAVRCLEVFSLPVFRFWISKGAAFIPLVFALSFFRPASAGFVQLLPHFLTLERPGFCPAFVQHWTPFCPAAGGASLIEPLWEASYPPVSIRRGPSVFILHQNERGDERRQGDRQNDADAAGDAADDLRGHIGGADELPGIQPQRIQIDDEGQAAAQKCQDQGVGHGTHHIPAGYSIPERNRARPSRSGATVCTSVSAEEMLMARPSRRPAH